MNKTISALLAAAFASLPVLAAPNVSMEQIMANPDWIGNAPERPLISSDGNTLYYQQKQIGSPLYDTWQLSLSGDMKPSKLALPETVTLENDSRIFSSDGSVVAWLSQGDLYVRENGHTRALTRTGKAGRLVGLIGNERVVLLQDESLVAIRLRDGFIELLASLAMKDEDKNEPASDVLSQQQMRLFDIIKLREQRNAESRERNEALAKLPTTAPKPFYFGKGMRLETVSVSPNGRYLLVGVDKEKRDGRGDKMPEYVSGDGYVGVRDVRSKVGNDQPDNESVYLIDLQTGSKRLISNDNLPGIKDDPLLDLKKAAAKRAGKSLEKSKGNRAIYVHHWPTGGVHWSADGSQVAVNLFSYDNKDRWLVAVDFDKAEWRLLHRLHDPAWVNDSEFNEFGWLPDNRFWYTSEETGYSHLYVKPLKGKAKALTKGKFEVNRVQLTRDGNWLYYRANKNHPGNHEVYRVNADGSRDEAVSALGGDNEFVLSPVGEAVVVTHSTTTRPPELYWQQPGQPAKPLTDTVSAEFKTIPWVAPEIIAVPSSHGKQPVYSRVYRNANTQQGEKKPAVMFVHGAGYLQNAHMGWSGYFREYMFHNLLLAQGYVVIDMDYRASEGYGRDWRTAIYQRMGTPELEDYLDGVEWLVNEANVDRNRIGIYGGSYGGFMTFMALFKTPDVFAAGAALRPVTDWAHYNHGYTSNILNTPEVDPDAYLRSSPIEFASGLKNPLLICSGMLDDNVFFQDSVRLVQRLIELKKPQFEMAIYPVEPHGFREPESWLDEYRRIYRLMEREVKNRPINAKSAE